MAGKRNRSRTAASAQEKGKRTKLYPHLAPTVKDAEANLEPQPDMSAKSNDAAKVIRTETIKEIVVPKSEADTTVAKLETIKAVVAPPNSTKTVDSDLISWDDLSSTKKKNPDQTTDDFEDGIDIFADNDSTSNALIGTNPDTRKANTAKVKEDQIAPNTESTDELANQIEAVPASKEKKITTEVPIAKQAEQIEVTQNGEPHENTNKEKEAEHQEKPEAISAFGRNVIFQSIKYNLDNTENLAYWIGLGAVGSTDTRQINAGNIKLEISVKYIGLQKEESMVKESEPVAETQEAGKAEDNQKAVKIEIKKECLYDTEEGILPSIETAPDLAVDTAGATKEQLHNTVITPVTSATIATKTAVACRFGAKCSRRDTCKFDHSEGARKKMCTFVNTTIGCKNNTCPFSHDHLGVICKSSPYRSNCSNTHKCAFKHQDDVMSGKAEPSKSKTTKPALDDDNRYITAAEIAQKAAVARASREVSVASATSAPPANAPTGPQHGVKRGRSNEDADAGPNPQRPRTNNFQMGPNQGRQQHWNHPSQQQGNVPHSDQGFSIRGVAGRA
ncbi:hypothetical protein PtrV1_09403 [Pyrenophora tritici-repentis]|uniref:PRP38-assoc multi-domain protein n=1 Tax=Pyrenophora tritici-repentis TaxID=45151 RepID=A0A5M9L6J7_9PLEO|nr:hypothetical protein PtrV1_09403 [Pyrenophora tritici-repentis]KAF7568379.1 PRP38-assoc multi-domain protein [Pyrenophora tritici-repentis]KAI0581809.1 hypothetical protein Alg215_04516 [Pyrenophora tritici-repentis]